MDQLERAREELRRASDEAEDPAVAERIRTARDHVDASLRAHPQAG